jgi:tetratricopeptide (TPR) repeat protein
MALEPPDQMHWRAATGFVELGMYLDATAELEKIDPFNRAAPKILALRMEIYRGLEKWELMQVVAQKLAEFQPDNVQWVTSLAYAARRANSIEAAKQILIKAEPKFPKEAIIKYNLACYFCQTRETETAKNYLKQAFKIDSNCRTMALDDPDLQPLWNDL